jgi:hypothetical protein
VAAALGVPFQRPPLFAITADEIREYKSYSVQKNNHCEQLDSAGPIRIRPNGDVAVCCQTLVFGNLYQQSFDEIINSPLYTQYRNAIADGAPLSPCDHCRWLYRSAPYLYDSSVYNLDIPAEERNNDRSPDFEKEGFFNWINELSEDRLRAQLQAHYRAKARTPMAQAASEIVANFTRLKDISDNVIRLIKANKKVVVYPAGGKSEWYLTNTPLAHLDILGFSDFAPRLHGTQFHGYRVYAPADIPALKPDMVIVISEQNREKIIAELAATVGVGIEVRSV